jgi:nitroimidazol reductase NimA-like FMN-containing flavoprotein (pyridoxamine 5'-phosphate oxidase superfamily)
MAELKQAHAVAVPTPGRPEMPQGYGVPEGAQGLLPWAHAHERLEKARTYWICTTRPDGRPHSSPVWGVWLRNMLYFDGSPATRRVRNIKANPAVSVHLESGDDVVIVEGEAHEVHHPDHAITTQLAAMYAAKYAGYNPAPDSWDHGGLYAITVHKVIAWTNLAKDPTRWLFKP